MTRGKRIFLWIAGSLAGLIVILIVAAVLIVRTAWFRDFVREKIVSATEESTGGRVDIGSFDFDWRHLRATIRNFVLHGTEPAGQQPLFQASLIQLDLRLFSGIEHMVDLANLQVQMPQAHLIVFPNGQTNVPTPKVKSTSNTSGLETVVDLKIGHFDLENGSFLFNAEKTAFQAQGENLRAQLFYNSAKPGYQGQLNIQPLVLASGRNAPVNLNIALPVVLGKDSIQVNNARIVSPQSLITLTASVDHMAAPRISGHLNANVNLAEAGRAAGVSLPIATGRNLPDAVNADVDMTSDQNTVRVASARVTLGDTNLQASGTLLDSSGQGTVQFKGSLALGQLGRLFRVSAQPEGMVQLAGNAKLVGESGYQVNADVNAPDLSIVQGTQRFRNISLSAALSANPQAIDVSMLRLGALGGELTGKADLQNMALLHFSGRLNHFDIATLAGTFSKQRLPYDGVISGTLNAEDNIKAPATTGLRAMVALAISPAGRGVPVTGRLNADYNGASQLVSVPDSYIALPNTRLDISGSLDKQIQLKLVSRNLNDFQPALAMASKGPPSPMPVQLHNGNATITGAVSGKLSDPHIAAHVQITSFSVQDRAFDRFAADIAASSSSAQVSNGVLARGNAQVQLAARLGLHNWSALPSDPLSATATIRNADVADFAALAGDKTLPLTGALNAAAQIMGTVGNPTGNVNLTAVNGMIDDQPYDRIAMNANLSDQLVNLTSAQLVLGNAQINLNGTFRHPRDSFETGTLQAHLASTRIELDQLQAVRKMRPGLGGTLQMNADAAANLQQANGQSEVLLTSLNANAGARGLRLQGRNLGDFTATAQTSGMAVNYQVNSDFAGSTIRVTGATQLARDYPTNASASISNLPVEQVLAVAGETGIAAKGMLSANAQVSGTLSNPQANASLNLTRAVVENEPIDSLETRITYSNQLVDIPSLALTSGQAHVDFSGSFEHPQGDFEDGRLRFRLASNSIDLGRLHFIQTERPGLNGTLQLNAEGDANLRKPAQGSSTPEVLFSSLNSNTSLRGLRINQTPLGDLTATAQTRGTDLVFNLNSNLAGSKIQGTGEAQLRNDYPFSAQLNLSNLTYAGLQPLLSSGTTETKPPFAAVMDGQIQIAGAATKPQQLSGSARITRIQVTAQAQNTPMQLQNDGPVVFALANQTVNIQSAHITGPSTDIKIGGTVAMNAKTPLNIKVDATTNLSLAQNFDSNIYSSGSIVLDAAVRGTFSQPLVNGQLRLQNASFNMVSLPDGISNANGVIAFNGNNAVIENLTGETGGGKLSFAGFAGTMTAGGFRFNLQAKANGVRVRTPQGASVVLDAALNLTGTTTQSVLGGNVTVNRIGFNPHSDFGSMLSSLSSPPQAATVTTGPLSGMKLDIRVRTSPALVVQTTLAQSLNATADLTVRGTVDNPGMLGRVSITQGKLAFFGNTYTVNTGNISFFNPLSIDPILDIDLETTAQGVDVTINVSGPVNNMKLTYRSDPPLQFDEIVALLAVGRTPTSDPNIVVNQPTPPPQSLQQMGESAIVGQAVANPLANRLSRVFGITQLKIDPMFTGGSILPQARVTLQQQVASNITFTYIEDLSQANAEIFRVEWDVNPRWSVVALRDENGQFGVDFFYKRQFR